MDKDTKLGVFGCLFALILIVGVMFSVVELYSLH